MSDLDFYAHVATRGEVLGVGIGSRPADWEAALRSSYTDNRSPGLMQRDFGLVELSFQEADGAKPDWSCFGIGVEVHRLLHGATVPPPLRDAYGQFSRRARFDDLSALILRAGYSIEPDNDDTTEDIHRYRVPESGARIFVVADADPYGYGVDPDDPDERQVGDVFGISVSPAWWAAKS
ncbi:hypothetical protein ACIA78_39620 [Streptomyces xanthochromogenes]|uniref:hypothetical protein n=1 Tax=Streptomyces xanthochromogenes TaxID=67384 RepID=UPI0037B5393B